MLPTGHIGEHTLQISATNNLIMEPGDWQATSKYLLEMPIITATLDFLGARL